MTTATPTRRQVVTCPFCKGRPADGPLACTVCGGRGMVLADPRQLCLPLLDKEAGR